MLRSLSSRLVVTTLALTLTAITALAAPPARGIPYSGRLELDGAPVTGTVPMLFRLYDAPSGGNLLFDQPLSVEVRGGAFAVVLGTVAGEELGEGVFTASALYLEIVVNSVPMQGRQQVFAASQAVRAGQADNFTVSSTLSAASVQATNVATTNLTAASIDTAGRMHISNHSDDIYLLARAGQVRVSNAWGGNGNLTVDGDLRAPNIVSTTGAVFAGQYKHDCTWSVYGTHDCGCPAGHNVLGGGATCEHGFLYESRPINASTWRVSCAFGESHEWPKNVIGMTLICARLGY